MIQNKRNILISILVVLAIVIVTAILVCTLPRSTKVSHILNAVKLDSQGNAIGSVTISVECKKKDYLFRQDSLDICISPFDRYQNIQPIENQDSSDKGTYTIFPDGGIYYTTYSAYDKVSGKTVFCTIAFSQDLTHWLFRDDVNSIYYLASADGTHTTAELLGYFQAFFNINDGTLNWNMEGYHVTQDGTVTNPVAFTMSGEIGNSNDILTALTLEIDLPENFPYTIQVNEFYCHNKDLESFQYYVMTNFCLDKNALEDKPAFIALDVSKGYAAFVWPDQSVLYASAAKDTALDSIVQHFERFVRACGSSQPSTDGTLDWNMQASYVSSDGTVLDTMAITVTGSIEKGQGAHDVLNLYIHLPESFRFLIPTHEATQFHSPTNKPDSIPYYEGNAYCLDRNSDELVLVKLALSEDQKILILHFSTEPGKYLVASVDDTVTPQQILSYFERIVKTVGAE